MALGSEQKSYKSAGRAGRCEPDSALTPTKEAIMAALALKPGIVTGKALDELFAYCKEARCALPAVNVVGSHTANAALEAARQAKAPIIIQYSHGGGQFNAGKQLDNKQHQASIAGSIAGAHHVR